MAATALERRDDVINFSVVRNTSTFFETAPRTAPPQDERLVGLVFIQKTGSSPKRVGDFITLSVAIAVFLPPLLRGSR